LLLLFLRIELLLIDNFGLDSLGNGSDLDILQFIDKTEIENHQAYDQRM